MRVFISWSGEVSRQVGNVFNDYLPCVLNSCQPFYSPEMNKGTIWFGRIVDELDQSAVGIVCLTRENLHNPWILFESGALAKRYGKEKACIFLFDLEPSDIPPPLSLLNATKNTKEDILRLIKTINSFSPQKLQDDILTRSFEAHWPQMANKFKEIKKSSAKQDDRPIRTDREVLDEILSLMRSQSNRPDEQENALYILTIMINRDAAAEKDLEDRLDGMLVQFFNQDLFSSKRKEAETYEFILRKKPSSSQVSELNRIISSIGHVRRNYTIRCADKPDYMPYDLLF